MFFDGWDDLVRILVVGTCAYAWLVFVLRLTGKRTLSKMNAFDLIVTVALGSTFATVLLSKSVSLSEGALALALLTLLQYAVAAASVRSPRFQALIKAEPSLLYRRGQFLEGALRRERVTREEVLAAVRAAGEPRLEAVEAVVLETDGSISVLPPPERGEADALQTVRRAGTP
jgi:uncharacterized membrane protein YcaP (DUF421 family)